MGIPSEQEIIRPGSPGKGKMFNQLALSATLYCVYGTTVALVFAPKRLLAALFLPRFLAWLVWRMEKTAQSPQHIQTIGGPLPASPRMLPVLPRPACLEEQWRTPELDLQSDRKKENILYCSQSTGHILGLIRSQVVCVAAAGRIAFGESVGGREPVNITHHELANALIRNEHLLRVTPLFNQETRFVLWHVFFFLPKFVLLS